MREFLINALGFTLLLTAMTIALKFGLTPVEASVVGLTIVIACTCFAASGRKN